MRMLSVTRPSQIPGVLKAEMRRQGRTQLDLARHMGVTQKHVSFMMSGKAGFTATSLFIVLEYLGAEITIRPRPEPIVQRRETGTIRQRMEP